VVFTGAGGNEVVQVVDRPDPVPGPEEVLVAARFAGLNPADLEQRAGRYQAPPGNPPDHPGLEVAGTVIAAGQRVTTWREGDRVFGLVAAGGLADQVAVHERCVAKIPDTLSDRDSAAVPEAFITAHDAVVTQANLRLGESLLVHGAAGGVGSAAVQIGVRAGARVLATVRSERSRHAVEVLGAEVSDDASFPAAVRDATAPRGVDVILELVGAHHLPGDLEVLAPCGRIAVVGVGAGHEAALDLRALMVRRATIFGTVLRSRPLEQKAAAVRAFEREVVPGLGLGAIRPLVESVIPVEDIHGAFDRLAAPGKVGKVLVDFG